MARIPESSSWEEEIELISRSERVSGGLDGVANRPLKSLTNRTRYLKDKANASGELIAEKVSAVKTFAEGATLESPREEILFDSYRLVWTGEFPKTVLAGSTPQGTGGIGAGRWAYTSDAVIRQHLDSSEAGLGADLVMTKLSVTVQDALTRRQGKAAYLSDLAPGIDLTKKTMDIVPLLLTAKEKGYDTVLLGEGHFLWASDLSEPIQMNILGNNESSYIKPIPASTNPNDGGAISLDSPGTWIHIDNSTLLNASVCLVNSVISGIAFFDARQDFKNWTLGARTDPDGNAVYEPTITGPAVQLTGTSVAYDNLFFLNSYDSLSIGAKGKRPQHIHAGDVHIALINMGVKIWGLGAGGSVDRIHIYPTWSQLWNYEGVAYRVNRYADSFGAAYQGGDKDDPQTFEQLLIKDVFIIGAADGLKLGGKGTRIVGARIDNCQRPVTGTSVDNSAYHVINNMWCTSFYGYTEKPRPDGTFYLFKNEGAGLLQIDNLVSPRADGYGIWAWGEATNMQLGNIQLYNVGFKGFEFGRSGVTSGTLSIRDLYVQCRDSTVIPYTWYDWAAIDAGGLHYQGNPTVVSQYLGTNDQTFSGRTRLDLSSIGKKSVDSNPEGWIRYGGLRGLDELVIRAASSDSSVTLPFQQWTVRNPGATNAAAGIGVANANASGNGYGRMELRASIAGTLTSLWQLNTNGLHFSPVNDNQLDVGTAARRVKQYYGVNSAILTSDASHKTEPRDISDAEVLAFWEIGQLPWVWQWLLKYQSEGDEARLHSGPTVQAAIAVMAANNLDWREYSAFCYDRWEAQEEITTEWEDEYDGAGILVRKAGSGVTQEAREAGEVYSFRKEELLFWILRATIEKHRTLELRLDVLESKR
ncbi:TPA: hypothetical protein UO477_003930 [Klebsiella pneumoniae]|nr:hypothetical protein [Klebsiella pneumoniae]HEL6479631.1 hypothetical protein [Klebsiella pneumoniae]HEL7756457.1 hypothetical protein [Klebsiella pneumoniae]